MKFLKILGAVVGVLLLAAVGSFFYAKHAASKRLDRDYTIEVAAIPMPFPLSPEEVAALRRKRSASAAAAAEAAPAANAEGAPAPEGSAAPSGDAPTAAPVAATPAGNAEAAPGADAGAQANGDAAAQPNAQPTPDEPKPAADALAGVDLRAIAFERAMARGKSYLESRAGCADCHGEDFGGKVVVDHPMMGRWVAPNITRGGITKDYKSEDWVRIIRHGVKPNGKPATMPSLDFTWFSDQEISDIATYISHLPAVDRDMGESTFGPVFAFLMAFGENQVSAEFIDHTTKRAVYPPSVSQASLELGKHLAATCMGCHGPEFAGGKIAGGDPAWPPAANLTFHETGLAKWTLLDFTQALREAKRPDGSAIDPIMPVSYTKNLKDTEIEALYLYFQSVPKVAKKP
jgi:cytochrome c553